MKTIRVIIAFLSVYLFVSALLIIIFFGVWLARYYPDSSQQEMAQITVSALSKDLSKNRFTILNQSKGTTCLINTITRASNSPSELRLLLVADTKTVSISYKRFKLHENLVPLGYMSMAQLNEITDADGKALYSRHVDLIDSFFEAVLSKWIARQDTTITLVAQQTAKKYTVTVSTEGVLSHEN